MKKIVYTLLLAGLSAYSANAAITDVNGVGLASNNRIVRYTDPSRPSSFDGPYTVSGITLGQVLVGLDTQPATGVVYVLGYNVGTSEAQLYTLDIRTNSVTAVNQNPMLLPLGQSGVASFSFDPISRPSEPVVQVWSNAGASYRLSAITGVILEVSGSPSVRMTTLDNPYSGTTFLADGTSRANGVVNADYTNGTPLIGATNAGITTMNGSSFEGTATHASVYPNPAVSLARVVLRSQPRGSVTLEIIDLNGRLMNSRLYAPGTPEYDLDVSSLAVGVYSLRILDGGKLIDQIQLLRRSE